MRAGVLGVGLAFATGVVVGALAVDSWAASTWRISQRGRNFQTDRVQIAAGDTIEFTNDDEYLHQIYVKGPDLNFDSAEQAPGQVISLRFRSPGSYEVRCRIHPKMYLSVIAQ